MHLRSITLKGFKSFPSRTKLEFSPGVSVVVGPNGSGKSNVTDAVLWALGEQSPLAVRGQTMKDVIFAGGGGPGGGAGLRPSRAAEVEVVIDNEDGSFATEFSELSIVRRLDRSGDGEYRLNGARCRLVDVLEVLSDTGLGKEMHSVVSQGRVEAIVHSRPRERRVLIEEAAGLGKHRKRRRRAQLKLERTEENLSRALDVEREARSRLRPLKRQAEAAELHERIERQALEARLELSREAVRRVRGELAAAEASAAARRAERDEADRSLAEVATRREAAEEELATRGRGRELVQTRLFAARSAAERIGLRLERARDHSRDAAERAERRERRLKLLEEAQAGGALAAQTTDRIALLEAELAQLEAGGQERKRGQLDEAGAEREAAEARLRELERAVEARRRELEEAERAARAARAERRDAERAAEGARAAAARAAGDLAAASHVASAAPPAPAGARTLSDHISVDPGYELALAGALGSLLHAGLVRDVQAGQALLDAAGDDGGAALVDSRAGSVPAPELGPAGADAPAEGAKPLLEHVRTERPAAALVERLLRGVWVVDSLDRLRGGFTGVAVTRVGRVLFAARGELAQAAASGEGRILEQRNRREQLRHASEVAGRAEADAVGALERAAAALAAADAAYDEAEVGLRRALRDRDTTADAVSRAVWLIEHRREPEGPGPDAVRRAELRAELRAERQLAERAEQQRRSRALEADGLRERIGRDQALSSSAERATAALGDARSAIEARSEVLAAELAAGAARGEQTAASLRELAHEEAELQGRLRQASEGVTAAEVAAQQVRDATAEAEAGLEEIAARLGLAAGPADEPLDHDRRQELEARIDRLARRREQLGPVNPLARSEYEDAVAHVEELERQRGDLESALAELEGLIRETDRRIRESFDQTFEAAARNFEEVVGHLFPGGRGRLRLTHPDGPRPVIGGEALQTAAGADPDGYPREGDEPGVEVEVTPAGKATRRLSLLSGGEKSLVALAFMFAVFLARPCPFYILDEVEAALDDVNIDRFLELIRRYSDRAQFIVITHQKRTMDAADCLYGVSMGADGVSRVVSRRLSTPGESPAEEVAPGDSAAA